MMWFFEALESYSKSKVKEIKTNFCKVTHDHDRDEKLLTLNY